MANNHRSLTVLACSAFSIDLCLCLEMHSGPAVLFASIHKYSGVLVKTFAFEPIINGLTMARIT